jgi:hypothetical protein
MSKILPPPSWTEAGKFLQDLAKRESEFDLQFRMRWKELQELYPKWHLVRMSGGSGFVTANAIRQFFNEYMARTLNHGYYSYPASFNVMESFLRFDEDLGCYDVRQEIDHVLSSTDYFNWYSHAGFPRDPAVLKDVIVDGTTYSFNFANDGETSYQVSTSNSSITIAGVSMIRHDDELSCMMIAGEKPANPPDGEVAELMANTKFDERRKEIVKGQMLDVASRYLAELPDCVRVILLSRFDLVAKKHEVRYINVDLGPSYQIWTDDPFALRELSVEDSQKYLAGSEEKLAHYADLFSALASLLFLPTIYAGEPKRVEETEFATELFADKKKKRVKEAIRTLGESECVFKRRVKCLTTTIDTEISSTQEIDPPDLEFSADGYWKALPAFQVGHDKEGVPIVGRTWVERKEMWTAKSPSKFLLKQDAAHLSGPDPGTIYVVRSPANHTDLYKIGLTRRTVKERAAELSSATGVALPFGVLASWNVGDCRAVEAEVHRRLEAYRVHSRREFFAVSLSTITSTITQVIDSTESS